jgi:hypothetical protein
MLIPSLLYINFNAIVLNLLVVAFPTVYDAQVYNAPQMSELDLFFFVDCSPAPWHKVSPHNFQPNLILPPFESNISPKLCSEHYFLITS